MRIKPKAHTGFVFVFFFLLSCSDKPTQPTNTTLMWSVDTLRYSLQTIVSDVYGVSPTNVYAVGYNYTAAIGTVWHFNGTTWSTQDMSQFGIHVLNGVFAFSEGQVFVVGKSVVASQNPPPNTTDTALVAILNGSTWTTFILPAKEVNSIWGSSSTDVWVGGDNGSVFRFNGSGWTESKVYEDVSITSLTGSSPSSIYALGYRLDEMPYDSIASFVFHYNGFGWIVQDSLIQNTFPANHSFGISDLWSLDDLTVLSVGYGIFRKGGGVWTEEFDNGTLFAGVRGTAPDRIFAVGSGIFKFDGKWSELNISINPNISILSVWSFEEEIFAVGTDGSISFSFHGK